LTERGFKVEIEERESTHKPKVVFRESEDDRYFVFDRSAENLAQALQRQPDRTPGGRAMLEFDRTGYKQIQQQYGDSLDISTKQLKLEATIATYEGHHGRGGVITGAIASEVAGQMGLQTGWTRISAAGSSMPKLSLTEEQLEPAARLLQDQGYQVEIKALDFSKVANVSLFNDGSIRLFGTPAEDIASALNLPIEQTRQNTPMLRVDAAQRETALETLKNAGYEIRDSQYQPSSNPAPATSRPTSKPELNSSPKADSAENSAGDSTANSVDTLRRLLGESVSQLVQYFQTSQLSEIKQTDSGITVQFDGRALTGQTPQGQVLSASLETRKIQSNFTEAATHHLARLARDTQQVVQSAQADRAARELG
ncbi:MAG TPA: hypothetical protein VL134_04410, partial [Leptolyngbya sp.]|nr:hypothetical protein [Leptolyngbya sp.]